MNKSVNEWLHDDCFKDLNTNGVLAFDQRQILVYAATSLNCTFFGFFAHCGYIPFFFIRCTIGQAPLLYLTF